MEKCVSFPTSLDRHWMRTFNLSAFTSREKKNPSPPPCIIFYLSGTFIIYVWCFLHLRHLSLTSSIMSISIFLHNAVKKESDWLLIQISRVTIIFNCLLKHLVGKYALFYISKMFLLCWISLSASTFFFFFRIVICLPEALVSWAVYFISLVW